MYKRLTLLAIVPILSLACNSDGTSKISPHASASVSSPDEGGRVVGTNPDRRPAGSASASYTSPGGDSAVVGTARAPNDDRTTTDRTATDRTTTTTVRESAPTDTYYEAHRDGKTYVFRTAADRDRFNNGDTNIRFETRTAPNGDTYMVQSDAADTLSREYDRAHPGTNRP